MLIHAVVLDISLLKEIRQHPDQSVFFPHRPDIWNEPLMDIHGPYGPMDPSTHDSSGRHLRQTFWLVHMAPAWHGWLRWSQVSLVAFFVASEHVPKLIPDGDGNLSTVSISSGYLKKTLKTLHMSFYSNHSTINLICFVSCFSDLFSTEQKFMLTNDLFPGRFLCDRADACRAGLRGLCGKLGSSTQLATQQSWQQQGGRSKVGR